MAVYREDIVDIDIETGTIKRTFMNKTLGEGDVNGNRFGFRCIRNGSPVPLNGNTVIGEFIRPDGTTVVINGGAVVGETAFVTLPQSCYVLEGNFQLSIKLAGSGDSVTVRIVDGTIVDTTLGTIIDPGEAVPDLSALMAVIADAEAAADIINGISIQAVLVEGEDYDIVVTKS